MMTEKNVVEAISRKNAKRVKPDYSKFPSNTKVEFDLSEIEKPLRRKYREDDVPTWILALLMVLVATLAYFVVSKTVEYQEVQAQELAKASEKQWDNFCAQAMKDHAATGTAAGEDLQELCN